MKKINKVSTITLSIALIFGIAGSTTTFAATDPGLGAAATFSVIAQTAITGVGTISGDVGLNSTGAGITALTDAMVGGTIYSTDAVAPSTASLNAAVQANLSSANDNISGQGATASVGPVLDGLSVTTGVYDIGAGRLNGGILTLDGPGIYIFRASSDLVSSGSINLTNGAKACDVYWQVDTLATINGSSFVGTIIAGTGVHFGNGTALNGRALALGGDLTLLNNTISGPSCASAPQSTPEAGTIVIVKKASPNSSLDFSFTGDLGNFDLDDDNNGTLPDELTFDDLDAETYDVTESVPNGWTLTNVSCTGDDESSWDDITDGVTVDLADGETVTCTFTNTEETATDTEETTTDTEETAEETIPEQTDVLPAGAPATGLGGVTAGTGTSVLGAFSTLLGLLGFAFVGKNEDLDE